MKDILVTAELIQIASEGRYEDVTLTLKRSDGILISIKGLTREEVSGGKLSLFDKYTFCIHRANESEAK